MKIKNILLGTVLSVATLQSFASITEISRGGISASISTLGLGAEYTYQVNDNMTIRGGYHAVSIDSDTDFDFEMNNASLIGDYHIADGYLRVSAGLIAMDGNITMTDTSAVTGTLTYEGKDFDQSEISSVKSEIDFGGTLPYIGIGLAKSPSTDGFGMSFDVGVVQPEFTPSFVANCQNPGTAACTVIKTAEQEVNDSLKADFELDGVIPVISAGISYSF